MKKEFSLNDLAALVGGEIIGDDTLVVNGLSPLDTATEGDLSFLAKAGRADLLGKTSASAVLVPIDITESDKTLIRVKNAYEAFAELLNLYEQSKPKKTGISKLASVSDTSILGKDLYVGEFTVVHENAIIGDRVQLYPYAKIPHALGGLDKGSAHVMVADHAHFKGKAAGLGIP